jgi:hypothetical protein
LKINCHGALRPRVSGGGDWLTILSGADRHGLEPVLVRPYGACDASGSIAKWVYRKSARM